MKNWFFILCCFILFIPKPAFAQLLNYDNKVDLVLSDGTHLVLYGADGKPNDYYYLPVNLRLAQRPDGVPEFLFLKYTTEQRADAGGVQGAIMHFLMEWGLTPTQLADAQQKIEALFGASTRRVYYGKNTKGVAIYKNVANSKDKPIIKGPAELQIEKDNSSFKIVSAIMEDKTLTKSIVSSGKAPLIPGGKVAAAASFDKNGAQLMAATFEKARSIADLSIALNYKYKLMAPAIEGSIMIYWDKFYQFLQEKGHNYSYSYYHCGDCEVDGKEYDSYTKESSNYAGWDKITEELRKRKIVEVKIDQKDIDNPITKDVVDYFMQSFMESISDAQEEQAVSEPATGSDSTPTKFASTYNFNMTKLRKRMESGYTYISLKYRAPIMREVQLVGNMASWYDAVKNNPKCVSSVNLNDPFFQHRDINLIVDLESEDIFSKEINYATVNIQKKRSSGNPFSEQVTIDRDFLKQKGVKATVTYARGEDKNSDAYEYKVQWSTRGGFLYPSSPTWQKGDWQGVTLAAPVSPRNIQFEGNLEELKAAGFTRATLQVRYYKFGREVETNIPLTVSKNESLVEQTIFTDKDTRGYAYRIILNHKDKGKIAFNFDPKINDDYVYITIPKEIKEENLDFWDKVRKAADAIIPPNTDGTVRPEHQILDKFLDVIKIFTPEKRG